MKVCVVGTGYVGLVSGSCLADVGNTVWCVDKDEAKVWRLNNGEIPIYEPGLEEVIRRNESEGRLFYTTDFAKGLSDVQICFITVDTPPDGNGRADITNVLAVAEMIGRLLDHYIVVVTKSTVPVGTTQKVKDVISKGLKSRGLDPEKMIDVASNPEFLKEGAAVDDFMKPDRVVVGVEKDGVAQKLHLLFQPFMRRQDRFLKMSIPSAELTKYAANAMLATRISFMNEMARLCERVGADIADVKRGLGSDPRIGPDFLYAGLGYGGSCFPKDAKAIIDLGRQHAAPLDVVESVDRANGAQREWFWNKIVAHFGGEAGLSGKRIAVWGLAFKANTDDVRQAPSVYLIERLIDAGSIVRAFDPVAEDNCRRALGVRGDRPIWAACAYEAVEGTDALIICTEWREFRSPDFQRMRRLMKSHVIFDGRNLYDPEYMRGIGFSYTGVGRQIAGL